MSAIRNSNVSARKLRSRAIQVESQARASGQPLWLRCRAALMAAALAAGSGACSDGDGSGTPQMIAVLSAFPAEGAAVVARATVTGTTTVNGHTFRFGTLGGVPVIMGLTGIGPVNAMMTTEALIAQVPVTGVVVSAVAGSTVQIGDVLVPEAWEFADGTSYPCTPQWLALARSVAADHVSLEQCTTAVTMPEKGQICFPDTPAIRVGGVGETTDPFGGKAMACTPGAGPVFGCDVTEAGASAEQTSAALATAAGDTTPIASDEETAAIAQQAAMHGLPFIAFRGVSDGAGDPLGNRGFPLQFFDYYPISANNAAAATVAFLERLKND